MSYYNGEGVTQSIEKALSLFEKACSGNDSDACYAIGVLYENGEGVPKSTEKAQQYYKKSCDLGNKKACKP